MKCDLLKKYVDSESLISDLEDINKNLKQYLDSFESISDLTNITVSLEKILEEVFEEDDFVKSTVNKAEFENAPNNNGGLDRQNMGMMSAPLLNRYRELSLKVIDNEIKIFSETDMGLHNINFTIREYIENIMELSFNEFVDFFNIIIEEIKNRFITHQQNEIKYKFNQEFKDFYFGDC